MKVVMLKVFDLKQNVHNPGSRYSEKKIASLGQDIKVNGIKSPLLIAKDGTTIGDGNRRYEAALALKMKTVPCIVTNFDPDQLLKLNEHSVSFTVSQELEALDLGMDASMMRMQTAERMVRVKREGGEDAWKAVQNKTASADGVHMAQVLLKRLGKKVHANVVSLAKYIKSQKITPVVKALTSKKFRGFEVLLWRDCVANKVLPEYLIVDMPLRKK